MLIDAGVYANMFLAYRFSHHLKIPFFSAAAGEAVMQVKNDTAEFQEPFADAMMDQPHSELTVFRSPFGECFVIAVDGEQVLFPESHIAAFDIKTIPAGLLVMVCQYG